MSDASETVLDELFRKTASYRNMVDTVEALMQSVASLQKSVELLTMLNKTLLQRQETLEKLISDMTNFADDVDDVTDVSELLNKKKLQN